MLKRIICNKQQRVFKAGVYMRGRQDENVRSLRKEECSGGGGGDRDGNEEDEGRK